MALAPGEMLYNRYHIQHILGQGGFAIVYLAQDTRLARRPVAVKELNLAQIPPAEAAAARELFQREARVLGQLNHPGIANVLDFFQEHGRQYLVTEYVAGETLEAVCQRYAGQQFDEAQVLAWARELCLALDYLHGRTQPIIFRDLKPANIMVQPNGQLKIIDFGIARYFKSGQTRDTHAMGTPGYAPPEQYGQGQTDARSDIYSLAVILHQLLTGHDPSQTPLALHTLPDIRALNARVSPRTAAAIQQALQPDPARRFANVAAFAGALSLTLGIHTAPPPPVQPGVGRRWVWLAAGMMVVIGLALLLTLARAREESPPAPTIALVAPTPLVVVITTTPEPTLTAAAVPPTDIPPPQPELPDTEAAPMATATPPPPPPDTVTPPPPPTVTPTTLFVAPASANNRPIVFDSTRAGGAAEIYIMESDGRNQRRLTNNSAQDDEPDLSADGGWIAYESYEAGNYMLYLMRADGSGRRALVSGRQPDWSPDGRYIAYETNSSPKQIWLVEVNGGQTWQLTDDRWENRTPSWSPDGQTLVMMSEINDVWQLVALNVNTLRQTQLTSDGVDKRFPAWSPDGRWIAYNTRTADNWPDKVWVMAASGHDARPVTAGEHDGRPAWSPDSQYLLYNTYVGGKWLVYRLHIASGVSEPLTTRGDDQRPDWGGS